MISIEEELLDRYFLGPGSQGPIRSVFVSDEDLLEIFQVEDIDAAVSQFIRRLPHYNSLVRILSADWTPPRRSNGSPDFVRILVFLCWMQVTKRRPRGQRNFREIIEGHLGRQYVQLRGLNVLWESLAHFLKSKHQIELLLPDVMPHSQIGRTLRIAFPTWRDRALLRKLRFRLNDQDHLKPHAVANKILTVGNLKEFAPSFQHYFEQWNHLRMAGDADADQSPFWRAWLGIVGEVPGNEWLELEVDEYGVVQLYSVSPDETTTSISNPMDALTNVSSSIRIAIKKGFIFMEPLGFGRFISNDHGTSRTLLVTEKAIADADTSSILTLRPLSNGWSLATFSGQLSGNQNVLPKAAGMRWTDGIHIGGSYLGRTPLTPVLECSSAPLVELDGSSIELGILDGRGVLPSGIYAGRIVAKSGSVNKAVTLIANAPEAHVDRIATLSRDQEFSEDGFLADTWPAGFLQAKSWLGERVMLAEEMPAIAEALYARSIRKLPAGQAYEIVSRGLAPNPGAPPAWEILRSFVDAGWLDMTSLRNVPAKRFVLRQLAVMPVGATRYLIVGPTPSAVIDRLERAAFASGVDLVQMQSSSPYGLPLYSLQFVEKQTLAEFCQRSQLSTIIGGQSKATLSQAVEDISLQGYNCVARLNPASGYFDPSHSPNEGGLYRFEHSSGSSPHLYVSFKAEGIAKFSTLSIALLHHCSSRPLFTYSDELVRPCARRIRLPATWARWLAAATCANPGPTKVNGTWSYAYPADMRSSRLLAGAVPMAITESAPPQWVIHALNSAGSKRRNLFANNVLTSCRHGGVLR